MSNTIDPHAFRQALGHYASGIAIIGGSISGEPIGFTCQSFYSVSISPPLVSFSVMRSSTSWPRIRSAGKFSVNVLSGEQGDLSNAFSRSGADKWAGVDWKATTNDNPIIEGALLWLDCSIFAEHEAGDHSIVVGHVNELGLCSSAEQRSPLLYFKGQYHQLAGAPRLRNESRRSSALAGADDDGSAA